MRRDELIANLVLQFGLPLVAVVTILVCSILLSLLTAVPAYYIFIMLLFWAVGFLMFLKAKLSIIRQGKLFSFGPKGMSRTNQILYVLGYVVMGVALTFALVLIGFYRLGT